MDTENLEESEPQLVLPSPSASPLFAGAGRGRFVFAPMRHRVDDVAADLENAAEDTAEARLDIKFTNGSVTTLTDPCDLRRLVRPKDVASIRIHFAYKDGSTLTGSPISQYLPGSICLDDAPDVRFLGTDYAQKETQSRIKGYRLYRDWTARQAKASAVFSILLRGAWLTLVVFCTISILFVILRGADPTPPPDAMVAGMLLFPAAVFIPTRRFEWPFRIIGTRMKKLKRSSSGIGVEKWSVKAGIIQTVKFILTVLAAVLASLIVYFLVPK